MSEVFVTVDGRIGITFRFKPETVTTIVRDANRLRKRGLSTARWWPVRFKPETVDAVVRAAERVRKRQERAARAQRAVQNPSGGA